MKNLAALLLLIFAINAQAQTVKHVVIIGIDGLSTDGVKTAKTPNIHKLMEQGSYSFQCKAQMPTVSSPNWASVIDGAPPKDHGIWSNAWKVHDIKDSVYCHGKKGHIFPTIFRVMREQKKHSKIIIFSAWWSFVRLVEPRVCNVKQRTLFTGLTTSRVVTSIRVRKPDLLFLHLNDVDETGHKYGHSTPRYYEAVEEADKSVGRIVAAIEKAGIANETVVMIIADHGGKGHGHGGDSPQEVNIPYVMEGPGIKKNYELKQVHNNYDGTATLAKILGLTPPDCWEGKVIDEIFEGK